LDLAGGEEEVLLRTGRLSLAEKGVKTGVVAEEDSSSLSSSTEEVETKGSERCCRRFSDLACGFQDFLSCGCCWSRLGWGGVVPRGSWVPRWERRQGQEQEQEEVAAGPWTCEVDGAS
jgi:hypothetical protein